MTDYNDKTYKRPSRIDTWEKHSSNEKTDLDKCLNLNPTSNEPLQNCDKVIEGKIIKLYKLDFELKILKLREKISPWVLLPLL